ncbi:MAG: ubiquinol-cytochrome c reductase cytochrome b subunit [Solirubrobacteraceae bacterium]|jgi:ubiquinol-cytochrome c reductase cytochrome b subunit|nr:ubiquinol-cytochrome c reductase cytochrome b subunit [Solirubrobacteraceae bacterium]
MSPDLDPVAFVDQRLGAARVLRKALRYVFPDHWSFLLGEMALYAFVVLVATGVFLALFFEPSTAQMTWHGPYAPLDGTEMSRAYGSALDLSLTVPAGLLMRQTHHWAALLFVVAITLHLLRVVFTGAFRRPRELTYVVGVTLLTLAVVEGYAGYSLLDDLISGMGLAIGYSTALSLPGIGGALGTLLWDGPFPGGPAFESRLFIVHVFLLPAALATLIGLHLWLVVRTRHAQFPGPGRRERNVVGSPLWPAYALRSLGWLFAVAAVLVLLGGLVQINPVWQWGPFEPWVGENGAQPDWYLGWLIGALRLMPNWEPTLFGRTLAPNPFFGGVVFPGIVFGFLYALPAIDRVLFTRDRVEHHLLDRARDNPRRTGLLAAMLVFVVLIFFFGSADRVFLSLSVPYELQLWLARGLVVIAPPLAYTLTRRWCEALRRSAAHPLRAVDAELRAPPAALAAETQEDALARSE